MKILVADDDDFSRTLLVRALEGLKHEVTAAPDGRAAWKALRRQYFPVLITDWLMPHFSGPELCRLIRKVARDNYTYIILLTVLEGKENYLQGMGAGADDFLTKPFDEDQLAARLHVAERILGLRQHVRRLEGLLPICAYCKKIRDEQQQWQEVERYVAARSETTFSHSICPECLKRQMPEVYADLNPD